MTRPRSSRGFHPRGPRRLTDWALGPGGNDLATLDVSSTSSSGTEVLGQGISPTNSQLTIVRVRGTISSRLTVAGAQGSGFHLVFGLGIATADAFTDIGATALPDPFDDSDWPGWMWLGSVHMHTSIGALAVGDPSVNPVITTIDAKSMRKLQLNEVMFLAMQSGETGTSVIEVAAYTRVLFKLP